MAYELAEFLTQLMNMVPEADTELAAIIRNQLIKQAVSDYSQVKPDEVSTDVTGDGGKYYDLLSSLTAYADSFSRIRSISYPAAVVASDESPHYLEPEDWDEDFYAGGTRYLFLPNHSPAATETFRVRYSAPYAWSAGTTTTSVNQSSHGFSANDFIYNDGSSWVSAGIGATANLLATHQATTITDADNFTATALGVAVPEVDFFAVCNRAACLACHALAERFARTSDSAITADSVNHTPRSSLFAERAREFCRLYNEHLSLSSGDEGQIELPHAEFVDLDPMPPGRDYLFRRRTTR